MTPKTVSFVVVFFSSVRVTCLMLSSGLLQKTTGIVNVFVAFFASVTTNRDFVVIFDFFIFFFTGSFFHCVLFFLLVASFSNFSPFLFFFIFSFFAFFGHCKRQENRRKVPVVKISTFPCEIDILDLGGQREEGGV